MTTKYYVDTNGKYLGGFGADPEGNYHPPEGAIEVPFPPDSANDIWNGSEWVDPPPTPEERIAQIDAKLISNDMKMIRPSAAISAAMISSQEILDADMERLQELMSENDALREERRTLTGG